MTVLIPTTYFDPPKTLDAAVTPIPKSSSAPLQVIADSGHAFNVGIAFVDQTNMFVGVYIGVVGLETLACIIGGGTTGVAFGRFPRNSRVSLRSMDDVAITSGLLSANLVTA